jgi:hypothetical protein
MPQYDPIYATVLDPHGQTLHLKANITRNQKRALFIYNVSRWEHSAEFTGKNRQLRVGDKQKKTYQTNTKPDGAIPEYMIQDFIAVSMYFVLVSFVYPSKPSHLFILRLTPEPDQDPELCNILAGETAENSPPSTLRLRSKPDFLTFGVDALRDRSKKSRTSRALDWVSHFLRFVPPAHSLTFRKKPLTF